MTTKQYLQQYTHEFYRTSAPQNRMTMLMEQYQQQQHWGHCLHECCQNFKQTLQNLWRRIEGHSQLAEQRRALLKMDAHQLRDIGISRSEALRIARGR